MRRLGAKYALLIVETRATDEAFPTVAGATTGLTRTQRRLIFWITLALLSLPIVIATVQNIDTLSRSIGDLANIQFHVEDMPGRIPLVGVYSKFGFHHPGPMLYYVVALPVHLFGAFGLALSGALVAIASLGGILLVLFRRGGAALFALGAVFCVVLIRWMALDILTAWNPYILIMPFALAILLTWSVWCGDWRALPWLALVGSFVAQCHIGTAPTIGFMFVSAALWTAIERVRHRCPTRPIVTAAIVLFLAWLPPLIEQFTNDPGNISQILGVNTGSAGEQTLGLPNALGLLGYLLSRIDPLFPNSIRTAERAAAAQPSSIALLLIPALLLGLSAFLAARHRMRDELRLTVLIAALMPTTVIFLATIPSAVSVYLVRWVVVIYCIIWLDLLWVVLHLVRSRVAGRPSLRLVTALGAVGLLGIGLLPLEETFQHTENAMGSAAILTLDAPIADAIEGCGLTLVNVTTDTSIRWVAASTFAVGVVADLRHQGTKAVLGRLFDFPAGPHYTINGRTADCTVTLAVSTAAAPMPQPRKAGPLVAEFDSLSPDERIEYQDLVSREGDLDTGDQARLAHLQSKARSVRATVGREIA